MGLTRPKYSQIYDTDWKNSVRVATTGDVGDLLNSNVQPNSIDGVSLAINDRILVKDQANSTQNGLYFVRTVGTGSDGWWARSPDANQNAFVTNGLTVDVSSGSTHAGTTWKLTTADPISLGTTSLTFSRLYATTVAAGTNAEIQFNDAGALGANPNLSFDKITSELNVTGNVNATYFLGDGSHLTGINASSDRIFAGSSNVIVTSNYVNVAINSSNVATFKSTGVSTTGNVFLANSAGGTGARMVYNQVAQSIDFYFDV